MALDVIGCTRELVAVDTTPTRGTRPAVSTVLAMLDQVGMRPRVLEARLPEGPQAAIVATKGPTLLPGGLLLVAHLDTAEPGDRDRWPGGDPYTLHTADDGSLVGLGVADAKGALAGMVRALGDLAGAQFKRSLSLAVTFDGMRGRRGVGFVLDSWEGSVPGQAIVAGPTGLVSAVGHPGWAVLRVAVSAPGGKAVEGLAVRLTASGRAVHAVNPGRGRSAVLRLLRFLESEAVGTQALSIEGGRSAAAVPDSCDAVIATSGPPPSGTPQMTVATLGVVEAGPPLNRALLVLRRLVDDLSADSAVSAVNLGRVTGSAGKLVAEIGLVPSGGSRAAVSAACRIAGRVGASDGLDVEATIVGEWEPLTGDGPQISFPTEAAVLASRGIRARVLGPGEVPGCDGRAGEAAPAHRLWAGSKAYREAIEEVCVR